MVAPTAVPDWVLWQQRDFPNANLLLLGGEVPTLVDSGFVGDADKTAAWARRHAPGLSLVVNTHWHSDHVGGNATLQAHGVGVAASSDDAASVNRRDPGCCSAQRLDQPVPPYAVDHPLADGDVRRLGEADWEVIATPGHTPGHLSLWQPEERLLVTGDALSAYDVGWVDLALNGPEAAAIALASLERLADLGPRVLLTSHGPVPTDTGAALAAAHRRASRLVDDHAGAVWYGARRVFAFALMIRSGIPTDQVESYLLEREWLRDAATSLGLTPVALATELVDSMGASGATVVRDGRLCAAAPHDPVQSAALHQPWPSDW
ncbi:hypothetical protein ASG90_18835 [Nocardioides sp. Soil797]|nr:hypothetical protein ASG90_18835 [Nocardioides sp. Soil797]